MEQEALGKLADSIAAIEGQDQRLRHIGTLRTELSPELASEFVRRARAATRSDPGDAIEFAQLGEAVATRVNDETVRIASLRALGQAFIVYSRFPEALRALDVAATAARRQRDEQLVAEIDTMRLHPLVHLEHYVEARATGERVLAGFRENDDRTGQIRAHMALADLAFRLDQMRRALHHYTQVDGLLTPETPDRFHAVLAANRANALEARNRFRAAARHFERARDLFAAAGCEHSVAQVEYNASYADALRGEYQSALKGYARTEEIFLRMEDERHLGLIDLERAEILVHLNMPDEAATLAARAEERFGKLKMEKECAQAAQMAGRAAELDGSPEKAEAALRRAQDLFRDLGLTERELACLVQRGRLALQLEDDAKARCCAEEAAALVRETENPLSAVSIELLRATIDLHDGNATAALHRTDGVRMTCRHVHAPWVQIETHRLMGRAYAARGQNEEAILAYKHAIDALECYRGGVPPDEYMAAFLAGRSELYSEVVALLTRAGYGEMAFEYTERAKSRALVDLMAERSQETPASVTSLTARRIRRLRQNLNAIYQRLFRHENGGEKRSARALRHARAQAGALEEEMAQLLRRSRMSNRESASLQAVDAPDLATVRKDLEPDTALIEYMVTADELITFVVTRETFHVVRQDVGSNELRRLLERFRFHLAKYDREKVTAEELVLRATRANLENLATHLLAPIVEHLEVHRLLIIPHGVLHGMPFHALPWNDGWVADRFEVVYAPSAAVYGFCRDKARREGGPASVFGLPDSVAPEIEREVRSVADVLGTDRLHVGDGATLAQLRTDAESARVLHIATHGMFRREQPMLSSIRLADTWLNLYDIYELELDCELVVLSTCESGIADVTDGDEVLGLTRGFLYAGARALLASQWRVNDATTAEFMETFYRHLQEHGDAAAAHRSAMAEIRAQRPHPYYWAPFFLTGRPKEGSTGAWRKPVVRPEAVRS